MRAAAIASRRFWPPDVIGSLRAAPTRGLTGMAPARSPRRRDPSLPSRRCLSKEGCFLPSALTSGVSSRLHAERKPTIEFPRGSNLRDEIGRYWRIAQANWARVRSRGDRRAPRLALWRSTFVLALLCVTASLRTLFTATAPRLSSRTGRVYAWLLSRASVGGACPHRARCGGVDTLATSFGDGGRSPKRIWYCSRIPQRIRGCDVGSRLRRPHLRIVRDNASLTRTPRRDSRRDVQRIFAEGR